MKNIILYLSIITVLTTTTLTVAGCTDIKYLLITDNDIYDKTKKPAKLNALANDYMRKIREQENLSYYYDTYYSTKWKWKLNDRKQIIGYSHAEVFIYLGGYWKIIIQKTQKQGLFVSYTEKSARPFLESKDIFYSN